jgi:copper transport protein
MPSGGAWLIELRDAVSGKPLEAQGLTLALSNPQAGIEPLRRAARRQQDGRWRVDMGSLPLSGAGRWQLSIDILVDDFEQTTLEGMLSP